MSTADDVKRWFKQHWVEGGDNGDAPIHRWQLDYPSDIREPYFLPSGRVAQGWVVLQSELMAQMPDVRILAQWSPTFELTYPLDVERPDVVERVLAADSIDYSAYRCGFRFTVPTHVRKFSLSLELHGTRWPLQEISIAPSDATPPQTLKVLEGKQGWLFLDNDTNSSVDQYCGRLMLTEEGVAQWQAYLVELNALATRHSAISAVIVAPSKESVMGALYHPREEGVGGPIHQLLALPEAARFVYPVPELKALGDDAFIQTDTHWSHHGARAAAKALGKALGLDKKAVNKTFKKDKYRFYTHPGDLGSKFSPPRTCETVALKSFGFSKHRHFDNGLPNFGRLLMVHYDKALVSGTCLVFGSSSSYSMLSYLSRLFTHLVFVHTAGNLDPALVAAVEPDYLVVQTNARFVVQVPKAEQPLKALIEEKRARMTPDEQAAATKRQVSADENDALIQSLGLSPWVAL